MTFSIVARCADTGQLGLAIASSSPAVAARCAHVRAGVGAVATQNVTDPRLGPAALDLLERGDTAPGAVEVLAATRTHMEYRQLVVVDGAGRPAVWSGRGTLGLHGSQAGRDCVAAGNLLAHCDVPAAMAAHFERSTGELADRLLAALEAGLAVGGESGPVHSAGLLIATVGVPWPSTDLRVDWNEAGPIEALRKLHELWRPQVHSYVQRALDPARAPAFGVPGEA